MNFLASIDVFCDNFNSCCHMESFVRNGRVPHLEEVVAGLKEKGWEVSSNKTLCPRCKRMVG